MTELEIIYEKKKQLVTRKVGDEYIIVPVRTNVAEMDNIFTLNEVGAFVWENIDGKKTVQDIVNRLLEEFETDNDTATSDVLKFIGEIKPLLN